MYRYLIAMFLVLNTNVFRAQTEKGLVAKYSFNSGNANDEVGKNNAKTLGISYCKDRFGNDVSACYLQGDNSSYLNLGTSAILKPVCGSISLWFSMDNIVLGGRGALFNPLLLTKCSDGDDFYEGYYIGLDIGARRLAVATTVRPFQAMVRSTNQINSQKWYHVAITFDSTELSVYINGELEGQIDKSFANRYLATDSVMVGNSANVKNSRYFNGAIDDILIYNRVLSPEEIKDLYYAPNPTIISGYIKWGLTILGSFVLIAILAVISLRLYKSKLEREKAVNIVNARLNDLETKAIRTQMNPHFIFNSLNTLQRFILEDDNRNAHLYLTKFSKLLRRLLESSVADSISLAEEMEILNDYIEIEKLRTDNSFDFEIVSEIKDADKISIPFMLVQPFVENAIWHGLMPKKEDRRLRVSFSLLDNQRILCIVDDDGVGREYSGQHKDPLKKRSLAIDFIKQRLELLQKSTGINCSMEIIDKMKGNVSEGTQVKIIIPILN